MKSIHLKYRVKQNDQNIFILFLSLSHFFFTYCLHWGPICMDGNQSMYNNFHQTGWPENSWLCFFCLCIDCQRKEGQLILSVVICMKWGTILFMTFDFIGTPFHLFSLRTYLISFSRNQMNVNVQDIHKARCFQYGKCSGIEC